MQVQLTSDYSVLGSGITFSWSVTCPAQTTCSEGFTGPAGSCTACVAGKYKTSTGSATCTDCGAGKYSTSTQATAEGTCLACPSNSNSPSPSSALAACTCNAGFTGPDGGSCTNCVAGKYKINTGSAACTDCGAGTYSTSTGATLAATCVTCPINTFSGASASSCQPCQANALSVAGSVSQEFCYCKSGYAHAAGSYTCRICDPGTWNSQLGRTACSNCSVGLYSATYGAVGNETCLPCPLGQWSPEGSPSCNLCPVNSLAGPGSGSQTNCTCNAGYAGPNGGLCSARMNLTCSVCPADTYYAGGVCSTCTGNTTSVAGSEACQCKAGFTGGPSNCQPCPAGTYKRMAGSSACRSCQANSWSESSSALCACNAGYTGNTGDVCVACVAGKYKNVTGPATCTDCAGNRNSGAGSPNVTSCICNVGYTQVENAAMTYDVVYAQACVACEVGKFKGLTGVQACTTCAQNQSSVAASTICACVPGFTGPDGGPCAECAQGKYKNWLGSQACTTCPAFTYTAAVGMRLLVNCTCNTGYTGPHGVACVACAAGMYKDVTGSSACVTCPADTYSTLTIAAPSCTACNPGFKSFAGSSIVADCCDPNTTNARSPYYMLSSATQTQISQTSTLRYWGEIIPTYVVRVSSIPVLSFSKGDDQPPIPPTYISSGGYNGQAFLRFSKISSVSGVNYLGTEAIISPDNGITVVTVVRFVERIKGVFWSMAGNHQTNAFEINLSDTLRLCVFTRQSAYGAVPINELCTDTAVDINVWLQVSYTYHPDRTDKQQLKVVFSSVTNGMVVLSKTSTNMVMQYGGMWGRRSAIGYSTSDICASPHGHMIPTNNPACDRPNFDLAGFYFIHTLASDADISVLLGAIATGSQIYYEISNSCPCNAGFGGTGRSDCKSCAPGSYKSEVMSAPCSLCPVNMYSFAVQALNISSCLACPTGTVSMAGEIICFCAAGSTGPNFGPCELCEAGKYKNWRNSSVCVGCPPNSDSVPGTTLCPCNVGYTGPLGGPCIACVAGKYKETNGTAPCTTCPANSYEPDVAATVVTNCSCNAGYEGADGGPCLACPLGKYKDTNGTAPCVSCPVDTYIDVQASAYCKACPEFKTSPSGSAFVTECQCKQGYSGYTTTGVNLARSCGADGASPCATTAWSGSGSFMNDNFLQPQTPQGAWAINNVYTENPVWGYIDFGKVVEVRDFAMHVYGPNDWNNPNMHRFWVFASNTTSSTQPREDGSVQFCTKDVRRIPGSSTFGTCTAADFYVSPKVNWYDHYTSVTRCTCGAPVFGRYLMVWNDGINPNYLTIIEWQIFGLPSISCASCQLGKYKDTIGSALCTSCPADTYSAQRNATSIDTCLECPGNSTSVVASMSRDYCQCNVGFRHDGEGCAACVPGTFNPRLAQLACSNCTVGTYSLNFGATSNETCASCSATEYSPEGSPECLPCPPNSVAPARSGRIQDCGCIVGYTGASASLCVKCAPGKYKDITGNWLCQSCSANSYSLSGATNLTQCFCNDGFQGAYGPLCVGCATGKYKAGYNSSTCIDCPTNTYADREGMTACTSCVPTSASAVGSTSIWNCTCNAGYKGPTYQEVIAHDNFARSCGLLSNSACTATQSSSLTYAILPGVYDFLNPAMHANDNRSDTMSMTTFGSSQWWRVDFGRRVTVQAVRAMFGSSGIDMLYVHVGDVPSSTGNLICDTVSTQNTGSAWVTVQCGTPLTGQYLYVRNSVASEVVIGEIQVQGTEVLTKVWPDFCEECPAGTYKAEQGNVPCTACPSNTFSPSLAATNSSTCLGCFANSVSDAGSAQCDCDAGFSGAVEACSACPTATYKNVIGDSDCATCPVNSVIAENASRLVLPCTCVSGFELR